MSDRIEAELPPEDVDSAVRRVDSLEEEVEKVDSAVRLRRSAPEYGLGRPDDRLRPYLERIPGAER